MKRITKLFAALLCLLMLAACGAKDTPPAATPAPVAPPADIQTVPATNDAPEPPADASPAPAQVWPLTVTDDMGRSVTFDAPPERVAVLIGSFADTWLLAGGELIAAPKDAWEDFGLDLGEDVVNLGSYQKISMEALFDLEADLIIASANTKSQVAFLETLDSAKITSLFFDVNGFGDYLRMLKVCTELTGREDLYEQNGLKVEERVKAARDFALDSAEKNGAPSVLLLRAAASGVKAKGSDSTVLGIMLKDLGCVNIADGSDLLEELSLERIISDDPEHIFIVQQGNDDEGTKRAIEETLSGNPAWAGLSAVKADRVHYMDKHLYHFKPNARWGEAYEELAAILYGA